MTTTQNPKIWIRHKRRGQSLLGPGPNRPTHLIGVAAGALPALKILEASVRLRLPRLALSPDIGTLIVPFNRDMVVTGDPKLLSSQAVVALPDLQTDTIDASV